MIAVLFMADVDSNGAEPNLAFFEERAGVGSVDVLLGCIPQIKIFMHRVIFSCIDEISMKKE